MSNSLKKNQGRKGITLLEIVIVLVIISIISVISYASFVSLSKKQALERDASALTSLIEEARSLTTSGKEASNYGIYFEILSNRTVLFKGDIFDENDPENKEFFLSEKSIIAEVNLLGGGAQVVFKRLKGETDQSGSVALSLVNEPESKAFISIHPTGVIERF